jgi:hypothetical protein
MNGAAYPRRGDCVGLGSNLRCDSPLFDIHPSGSGDWSCYELLALCRNFEIVGRTHKAFYTMPRGRQFIVSKSHRALHSLLFLILCTKS